MAETPKDFNGCNNCKHLRTEGGYHCVAFPKGISMMFLSGTVPHIMPIDGQVGDTVWELADRR